MVTYRGNGITPRLRPAFSVYFNGEANRGARARANLASRRGKISADERELNGTAELTADVASYIFSSRLRRPRRRALASSTSMNSLAVLFHGHFLSVMVEGYSRAGEKELPQCRQGRCQGRL